MELSRRGFLKRGFLLGGGGLASSLSGGAFAAPKQKKVYKLANVQESTNICCYCSGGCGTICSTRDGELINLEGDPDHPVNLGGLCPTPPCGAFVTSSIPTAPCRLILTA